MDGEASSWGVIGMGQYQSDFWFLVIIMLFMILGFLRVNQQLEKIEKKIDDLGANAVSGIRPPPLPG